MRTLPLQKTELTDKQLSALLYHGSNIPINDFLELRQPTLYDILIKLDYEYYMSLISVFFINKDMVIIEDGVSITNYQIFCQMIQIDEDFGEKVKECCLLLFGRDDIGVYNNSLFFGENYFQRQELKENDFNKIVDILLKFNNLKIQKSKVYSTEKAQRIDAKMERHRERIRQQERKKDNITPLMARLECRHPNISNIWDKTIYQLNFYVVQLSVCEDYDASIVLAPYIKDNKIKHWSQV